MNHLVTILILLTTFQALAQTGRISGEIFDGGTNQRVPFANVSLFDQGFAKGIGGTVSDENGSFEIAKIPYGQYNLVISFIGYQSDTLSSILISAQHPRLTLGRIDLAPAIVNLSEVEVRATSQATVSEIDRRKYNASEFETAKGGTAADILNKLPAISVGPDGNITLRGTDQFMVYLNGKPTQMEPAVLLAQLSADAIENIEVITVPTARYDAQGKGGIINITTRKTTGEGLSVTGNVLAGGAPWANLTDRYSDYVNKDLRYGGALNAMYSKNKVSIYGGIYYNMRNVNGDRTGDARILQGDGSYYHMVASGERPEWYENFTTNVGADFVLTKNSQLSFSYLHGKRTEGRSAFYVYDNFYGDINKQPMEGIPLEEEWIYNPNTDDRIGIFNTANVDFSTKWNETSSLVISLLYENSALYRKLDNKDFAFNPVSMEVGDLQNHFRQSDDTPLNAFRLSMEYEKDFKNGRVLSVGIQPQILTQAGTFHYDTFNVEQNRWGAYTGLENDIDLYRGIYAGYGTYSGKSERFEYALGLRLEYTDQTLELANPDYFSIFDRPADSEYLVNQLDWFPTIHLSWDVAKNDKLMFSGSRRINRPPTKEMAPFLYRRHYEVYVVGDPALKPEYVSNLEITYDKLLGNQEVALTGFYRGTENAIFRVNTVYAEENVLIRSYTNSGNTSAFGAELNSNLTIGPNLTMFAGGSLYHFRVTGEVFGYTEDNQSTNWTLKGNLNWKLSDAFKFSADFNFKSATATAQGRNEMFYLANTALTFAPPKYSNWSLALRCLDILSSNLEALYTRAYDAEGTEIFYQDVAYYRNGPILEFGINYSFNSNGKNKKKPAKTFGDEQF